MEILGAIFVALLSFLTILYGYFKYSYEYWGSRNIPCDEPSIPYGTMKGFGKTLHPAVFLKNIYDKYKPQGHKLCGVYLFSQPTAVLLDLDLIKHILVKDFVNFTDRGFFYTKADPLSANLLLLDGEPWKEMRARLTPTFTSGKMKFMFPTVIEVGERFRDCLFEIAEQHDELEIKELLARFTTDVIGTCAFGIECNSLKFPNAEFRLYGRDVFAKPRHSPLVVFLLNEFRNVARALRIKRFSDEVIDFFVQVVRETVEYREKNNVSRNDFMDILIKLKNQETCEKNKITLDEIVAHTFIFFVAGFETSSTTLTYCLYELALNPDIQGKARKVIRDAFEKHQGKFTYEMMMDMPYIDQILEETLRKYPPLNLNREAKSNYQIPGTDITLEKGMRVLIPVFAIHMDPEYYPNPEKFDPDRFDKEEVKKRHPMQFLAFGDGPRNCIGLRFGMMQTRIGLVTLLNNFEISLGSRMSANICFDPQPPILSPKGGVYLKLKPIKTRD